MKTGSRINNTGLKKLKDLYVFFAIYMTSCFFFLENKEEVRFHDFLISIICILHEFSRYSQLNWVTGIAEIMANTVAYHVSMAIAPCLKQAQHSGEGWYSDVPLAISYNSSFPALAHPSLL